MSVFGSRAPGSSRMWVTANQPSPPSCLGPRVEEPASAAMGLALHEGSLVLQCGQSLLEPCDLGLSPRLALLVGLWLRDTPVLDLPVILEHRGKLSVGSVAVGRELGGGLIQRLGLRHFVFHILLLAGLRDLVLLRQLFVRRGRV